MRIAKSLAAFVVLAFVFGARSGEATDANALRVAWLTDEAAAQAASADAALAAAESQMQDATEEARRGQAAVLEGDDDPTLPLEAAGVGFEAAATPFGQADVELAQLGWTLRAIDPQATRPTLDIGPADVAAIGEQWRAAAPTCSILANLRRQAEASLGALDDALAALDADDPAAALNAADAAAAYVNRVRDFTDSLATLGFWVDTVDALIEAARDIALAAQAGDAASLAEAQIRYGAAAADAGRADQALTIALGEAAAQATGPASSSSAAALRAVASARDQLAGMSILR
ncbi:MAG: hypothetical protein ACRDFR_05525 [Candidatus Limnocylindria bacterium]